MPELFEKQGTGGQALRNWQRAGIDKVGAEDLVNHKVSKSFSSDGRSVLFEHKVEVPKSLADLPRVGVSFALPKVLRRLDGSVVAQVRTTPIAGALRFWVCGQVAQIDLHI